MFNRIRIKECKIDDPTAVVLAADVFLILKEYSGKSKAIRKRRNHSEKILDALCEGLFCGIVTDLEYGRVRNLVGADGLNNFFKTRIRSNKKARCFEVTIMYDLDEYKSMPSYGHLFNLTRSGNLHLPNLTSMIAAIELSKPIVSDDPHFWIYQNSINRTYKERRVKEKGLLPIYTTQDFYKMIEKCAERDF